MKRQSRLSGRQPPKGSYRSVPAGVPPVSPRRGLNSQKEAAARNDRKRQRRVGAFRRCLDLVRGLMVLVLAVAAVGGGGWAAWRAFEGSSLLILRDVAVEGNRLHDRKAVLERAGLELGMKLPLIRAGKVEDALRALPGVADVDVTRKWPSGLSIRITEQQPVACGYSRGWKGLAPDGSTLPGLAKDAADLPVIDGFASLGEARRAELGAFLEAARREYPSLYAGFSQLTVLGQPAARPVPARKDASRGPPEAAPKPLVPADLEIVLRDGHLKVQIEMGNKSLTSLEFLQTLMRRQGAALEGGRTVDLRVEGYAYVR